MRDARSTLRAGIGHRPMSAGSIHRTLASAIEAQVAARPDQVAVQVGRDALTYAALDAAADQVATELVDRLRGHGQSAIVAVVADQGIELVIAIVGVLKAGAAYLPIDASHPLDRSADIVRAAGAAAIVSDKGGLAAATTLARSALPIIAVTDGAGGPYGRPGRVDDPGLPAYIYPTSGSTGPPKLVVDSHRNVLHNIRRYTNSLAIGPGDRLSLVQSSAFSGAVSSLFGALVNGATCLPFDVRRQGTGALAGWVAEERLTMFHGVPILFRALCTGVAQYADVRVVRLEGDAAAWADVERFRRHFLPGAVLVNGLGTTETGLVRQFFVDHDTPIGEGGLPLGYAVPEMEVRIVDEAGRPQPPGTIGAIEVRSSHLALGYWGDPERTAAAFESDGSQRRYRTGDLGSIDADDRLVGSGRLDFVDKINGESLDVPDIERRLGAQPGIAAAVVVTRRDARTGSARLVGYVVPEAGQPPATDRLRRALARTLPRSSVPSIIVVLDSLPLDDNAKVDRARLPAPAPGRPKLETRYVAPRTDLERELVDIWEGLLDVRPIGVHDDFFDLGGDSLDAARLISELASRPGLAPADDAVVRASTIQDLARRLADPEITGLGTTWFAVAPDPSPGYFARIVRSFDRANGLRTLDLPSTEDTQRDVAAMAAAAATMIRADQPHGPYYIAGYCFGAVIALEIGHQLQAAGEDVAAIAMLGIGPVDFPTLVGPYLRSRPLRFRRWVRHHTKAANAAGGVRARIRYVLGHAVGRARWAASTVRVRTRGASRPFDGRVLVILGRASVGAYTARPNEIWRGLGRDVEVVLLPGKDGEMLRDPGAGRVAEILARTGSASERP